MQHPAGQPAEPVLVLPQTKSGATAAARTRTAGCWAGDCELGKAHRWGDCTAGHAGRAGASSLCRSYRLVHPSAWLPAEPVPVPLPKSDAVMPAPVDAAMPAPLTNSGIEKAVRSARLLVKDRA